MHEVSLKRKEIIRKFVNEYYLRDMTKEEVADMFCEVMDEIFRRSHFEAKYDDIKEKIERV